MTILPYLLAAWLLVIGLWGVVTSRNLVHLVVCLSVAQSSTYVLLLAIGYRSHAAAAVFGGTTPGPVGVDPIVQALCGADIIVGATVTALLLAIVIQVEKRTGTLDPERLAEIDD